MLPTCADTGFMLAPRRRGWGQKGDHWGLWWGNPQIASVQPAAQGIRVVLSCRKLWQDKQVRAGSLDQGKRYAERWCAVRVLVGVPMKEAVAQLVGDPPAPPAKPKRKPVESPQERRLREALKALPFTDPKLTPPT